LWDAVFYCAAQLLGAVAGVALASPVLQGAPAHKAVRYAATVPGIYGDCGSRKIPMRLINLDLSLIGRFRFWPIFRPFSPS
jgi:hypothetical protein